jgi:hypothetical protein
VSVDRDTFDLGSASVFEIERVILNSHCTLLVVTPQYLKSEWCLFESALIQTIDPAARHRRVLPVVIEKSDLPLRLRMLNYLDLTDATLQGQGLARLAVSLEGMSKRGVGGHSVPAVPFATGAIPWEPDAEPEVILEGVFLQPRHADLAFTIYNPSSPLLIVSGVDFLSVFFKLCQRPHSMRMYSGVRRTTLLVDVVRAASQPRVFRKVIKYSL